LKGIVLTAYDCDAMKTALLGCALLLAPTAVFGGKVPAEAWRPGTLADILDEQHTRTTGHTHTHGNRSTSTTTESTYSVPHYVIETDEYRYEVIGNGGDRRRALPVTINGPIKYAIVGTDLFVQDERGKEHKMTLVRKTLKVSQTDEHPK